MKNNPSRSGPAEHVEAIGKGAYAFAGMIRRIAVTLTTRAFWQVTGHMLLNGKPETLEVENFSGIGFYARPPASGKPEAIMVRPNGDPAANPIIVATRDEATRRAVAGGLAADETATFNSSTISVHTAAGEIEHKSVGGTAEALTLKSELVALKAAIAGAATFGDFKTAVAALGVPPGNWPTGTTVLKGE